MSPRFITNVALALVGAIIIIVSQALGAVATGWVAFGIALGILAMLGASQVDRGRGLPQRSLDGVTGVLAIWTVIASAVFTGGTLTWLSFAEGIAFVGLAVVALVVHELSTERTVHSLVIENGHTPVSEMRTAQHYSAS